jgi:hypothetical protein
MGVKERMNELKAWVVLALDVAIQRICKLSYSLIIKTQWQWIGLTSVIEPDFISY